MAGKRIFALDYGRGTMAGFCCNSTNVASFDPIMERGGEPSGFALMKDGTYRLGAALYSLGDADFRKMEKMCLNVKNLPDGKDELQIEYARAWREQIMRTYPDYFKECEEVWIIGCPTAKEWRCKTVIDNYRRIFEQAGFRNVIIVPESNAALMCLQKKFALLDNSDCRWGVLCIDLGAYSSDATHITPGEMPTAAPEAGTAPRCGPQRKKAKVHSVGGYVGASLIERMILAKNLEGVLCIEDNNAPEFRAAVAAKCRDDADFADFLLLQAKKMKERYFSAKARGTDYSQSDYVETVRIDALGGKRFLLAVNDVMIRAITEEEPVKAVLGDEFDKLPAEVKDYIGDMTWAGSLRKFIQDTMKAFPDFAEAKKAADGKRPPLVLTGGASLMGFVEDIIMQQFPGAEIYQDKAPMSTIAEGLLYFGPEKVNSAELLGHLAYILSHDAEGREVEQSSSVLNDVISRAHDKLGIEMINHTIGKMVVSIADCVNRWQRKEIDSVWIIPWAKGTFKNWFKDSWGDEYRQCIAAAQEFLAAELNKLYQSLLAGLGIEGTLLQTSDIQLAYAETFLKWWSSKSHAFDQLFERERPFYSSLPNCWFAWGRQAEYRDQKLAIKERNTELRELLFGLAQADFKSPKLYDPFKQECLAMVIQIIARKTRAISDDLLLEETFDEEN